MQNNLITPAKTLIQRFYLVGLRPSLRVAIRLKLSQHTNYSRSSGSILKYKPLPK